MAVEIKPLEWELLGGDSWRAPALFFGSFRVENYASGYIVLWSAPGISDTFIEGRWPTAEDAKAAAEADYRQRILSTLSLPAQEPVAWRYEYRDYPRKKHWAEYVSLTHVRECAANRECIRNVLPLYTSPQPEASVTDEMVERGAEGLRKMYHGDEDEPFHLMAKAVLTAALLPTHKPLQEEG